MEFVITNHALERFQERYPASRESPETVLLRLCSEARRLREKTASGHTVYEVAGMRFIGDVSGGRCVVVTVLSPDDLFEEGDDLLGAVEDYAAECAAARARLAAEAEKLLKEKTRAERVAGAIASAYHRTVRALKELG